MSTDPLPSTTSRVVELCAESLAACHAAVRGGAHRIELCTALNVGGLTPDERLVQAAVATSLPVHILLRPTAETFVYSREIYAEIERSLMTFKRMGVAGFVLGLLTPAGTVDRAHTEALVAQAHPLPVTFHRAFDDTADLHDALEDVIAAGCARVLTSGGAPDVVAGSTMLASLVQQAGDRIEIAVGGGLRLANAASVARQSRARHFHASLREQEPVEGANPSTLTARVEQLVRLLGALPSANQSSYATAGIGAAVSVSRAGR